MTSRAKLTVPDTHIHELSFAEPAPESIDEWCNSLPKANIGETSHQLYSGLIELSQLKSLPSTRLQMLEALRPTVYYCLEALSKHYLSDAAGLTSQQYKVAALCQALQNHLAIGYKQVALGYLDSDDTQIEQLAIATAIHRVINEFAHIILRTAELYSATPPDLWRETHQLYILARDNNLLDISVTDAANQPHTILDSYKRVLLFNLCNPNHLRRQEQEQVFMAIPLWADQIDLRIGANNSLFAADIQTDTPPGYRTFLDRDKSHQLLAIDTQRLLKSLRQLEARLPDNSETTTLELPKNINRMLLSHLIQAWGSMTQRSHERKPAQGTLVVSLGMSSSHYYLSHETEFQSWLGKQGLTEQTQGNQYQPNRSSDGWSEAVDAVERHDLSHISQVDQSITFLHTPVTTTSSDHILYEVGLIDSSPAGYSVYWYESIPRLVQTGEIIGIQQSPGQWNLAVIRWARLEQDNRLIIGIQLLTPHARPCAISILKKTHNQSQLLRGFLIPEIAAINLESSLIIPQVGCRIGQKVRLIENGQEVTAKLTACYEQTASFSQFHYQLLVGSHSSTPPPSDTTKTDDKDDGFETLWEIL